MADKKNKTTINPEIITAALYSNGYTSFVPSPYSTGFQTAAFSYRKTENRPSAAENFLINSKNDRHNAENAYSILSYLDDRGMVMVSQNGNEDISAYETISLPKNTPLDIPLGDAITNRRSKRNYTGDAFPFNYIASIIRSGFGITTHATVRLISDGTVRFPFRSVPSAGGLYPIELYMGAINIDGLAKGIYRYLPLFDNLIQTGKENSLNDLLKTFVVPDEIINCKYANAIFLLVAQPWKTMRKYGDRGLRFVFHETGAISQNIHLAVTALGIGSVDCASLCDDEMNEVLGMDGHFKSVVHSIILGNPG